MSLVLLHFARPGFLLLLPLLAWLLWRLGRSEAAGGRALRRAVDAHLLPRLLVGGASSGLALPGLALLLAVLALAGPRLERPADAAYRPDHARVLVVELSAAMDAAVGGARGWDALRLKILDLLRALPQGQTALVIYAAEPYMVAPPTSDVETLAHFVAEFEPGVMPVPGNRPERALAMAGRLLDNSGAAARDVIWITAGAVAGLAPDGTRVSLLHVGAAGAAGLAAIAAGSGGVHAQMAADGRDVQALAAHLGVRAWVAGADEGSGTEFGYWLLLPLLPVAALAFRGGAPGLLLALLLAGIAAPLPARAGDVAAAFADASAWRRLQAGDAAAAAAGFADPRWRAVASYRAGRYDAAAASLAGLEEADSHYNRGNALARQERLAEALAAYDAALAIKPGDADARHNRDLVARLLQQPPSGQGKPPPPAPELARVEATRLAERWLGSVPDDPGRLLRRKLLVEHQRRLAGEVRQPW